MKKSRNIISILLSCFLIMQLLVISPFSTAYAASSQIFYDGFESGNLSSGGWLNNNCTVQTKYKSEGTYAVMLNGDTSLTKAISTYGYKNIVVNYKSASVCPVQVEHFTCEWYDGKAWNTLESLSGAKSWSQITWSLPTGANDNPDFQLRFRSYNSASDFVYLDNIEILGSQHSYSVQKINMLNEKSALTSILTSTDANNDYFINDYIDGLFDGSTSGVSFNNTNHAYVQAQFQKSRLISRVRAYLGTYGQAQTWTIEAANSTADMDKKSGSYQLIMPESAQVTAGSWVEFNLPSPSSKSVWRISVNNASATNVVYLSEFEFWGADAGSPSAPSNLTATPVDARTISLKWGASTDDVDVVGYKVYRNGQVIGKTTVNSYIDTLLDKQTGYTYKVCAYDQAGNESLVSSEVSATTLDTMNFKTDYKVLLLYYDPIIKAGTYNYVQNGSTQSFVVAQDTKYSQLFGSSFDMDALNRFIENVKRSTGGSINYTMQIQEVNEYVPENAPDNPYSINGNNIVQFNKTGTTVAGSGMNWTKNSGVNYHKIIKDNNILPKIENESIDTLWLATSYDYHNFYETLMAGNGAFFINGAERKIDCSKKFYVFGYPGSIECMGHMVENAIGRKTSNWPRKWQYNVWSSFDVNSSSRTQTPTALNDWEKFTMTDSVNYGGNAYSSIDNAQVGDMHFPPYGYKNYSWDNYSQLFYNPDAMSEWKSYSGSWAVENSELSVEKTADAKIAAKEWNNDSRSFIVHDGSFTTNVKVSNSTGPSDAGVLFRASNMSTATNGYYAGIDAYDDLVILGSYNGGYYNTLMSYPMSIDPDKFYNLRVIADGKCIKVYVNDMVTPKITLNDDAFINGAFGYVARNTHAHFDNLSVKPCAKSYADNWYNYPNVQDTNPRVISSDEWGGGQDSYQQWCFDRIPRNPGTHTESNGSKFVNNWWAYLDFNHFDEKPITCTINPASFPVPPVVKLKVDSVGASNVAFSWTTPQNSGITGYNIYKDGVKLQTITNVSQTSFSQTGLISSTSYTYIVKAFNASGKESIDSTISISTTAN